MWKEKRSRDMPSVLSSPAPTLTRRELAQLRDAEAMYDREMVLEPSDTDAEVFPGDDLGDELVSLAVAFVQQSITLVQLAAELSGQLFGHFTRALFRSSSSSAKMIWQPIRLVSAMLLFATPAHAARPGQQQFSMPRTRSLSVHDFQTAQLSRMSTLRPHESFERGQSRPCHRRSNSVPGRQ